MSNSQFVVYTKISPNNSGYRSAKIDRITPHCAACQCSVEDLGGLFAAQSYQASSNYGIGVDGRVGLFVPEDCRSWCSSSNANDQRAVTIECASNNFAPHKMNNAVYNALISLCVDICYRNGKTVLTWISDKDKALSYIPKDGEMLLTVHRWFANKECPGEWLFSRMGELADIVTNRLKDKQIGYDLYRVQLGAFRDKDNAFRFLETVKNSGFPDAFITVVKDFYK